MKDKKKMPIRVAHLVNSTFGSVFSGHTHYLFSLLSGWKEADITLDLFGTKIKPLNLNSGEREYKLPHNSLWSNPKRQNRWGRIFWSINLLRLLVRRRNEYEIVHFHNLNWGSLLSPLILHRFGKKVVFTMSLMGDDNPSAIMQQPRGWLQVSLLRHFDGGIGLSTAMVEDASKHGIKNVICLPNFLTYPQLERNFPSSILEQNKTVFRNQIEISKNAKILLFIGSIIHRKGVDLLVNVFVELSKKFNDLYLVLIGPNNISESTGIDEDFVKNLRKIINENDLTQQVIWLGMVRDRVKIVDLLHSADIFVFPTRNEGLGNVLIEAGAARLPVVTSFLSGITDEIVKEGVSGYLVEPERSDLFAEAIKKLLLDDDLRKKMGEAGRSIVLEKFGFAEYCQKLKEFYISIYN